MKKLILTFCSIGPNYFTATSPTTYNVHPVEECMCSNFHLFVENATLTLRINGTPRDLNLLMNNSDSGSGWSVRGTSERQASVTLDGGN